MLYATVLLRLGGDCILREPVISSPDPYPPYYVKSYTVKLHILNYFIKIRRSGLQAYVKEEDQETIEYVICHSPSTSRRRLCILG